MRGHVIENMENDDHNNVLSLIFEFHLTWTTWILKIGIRPKMSLRWSGVEGLNQPRPSRQPVWVSGGLISKTDTRRGNWMVFALIYFLSFSVWRYSLSNNMQVKSF